METPIIKRKIKIIRRTPITTTQKDPKDEKAERAEKIATRFREAGMDEATIERILRYDLDDDEVEREIRRHCVREQRQQQQQQQQQQQHRFETPPGIRRLYEPGYVSPSRQRYPDSSSSDSDSRTNRFQQYWNRLQQQPQQSQQPQQDRQPRQQQQQHRERRRSPTPPVLGSRSGSRSDRSGSRSDYRYQESREKAPEESRDYGTRDYRNDSYRPTYDRDEQYHRGNYSAHNSSRGGPRPTDRPNPHNGRRY